MFLTRRLLVPMIILGAFYSIILTLPAVTHAQTCPEPHPMCIPPGRPPKPPDGKDGLPCMCSVGGGSQFGTCMATKCIGTGYDGSMGSGMPMLPMIPMIPMMMDMPSMEMMMPTPCPAGMARALGQEQNPYAPCDQNTTAADLTSTTVEVTSSTSSDSGTTETGTSILDTLFGTGDKTTTNTNPTSTQKPLIDSTSENPLLNTDSSKPKSETVETGTTSRSGGVLDGKNGVTLTGGDVDKKTNTGVGTFVGVAKGTVNSVVGSLCGAKPWQLSFVQKIFSSDFFDSLCSTHGYVGPTPKATTTAPTVQPTSATGIGLNCPTQVVKGQPAVIVWTCPATSTSSGIGFKTLGKAKGMASTTPLTKTTTFGVSCGPLKVKKCVVNVVVPRVDLVANPVRVPLNSRARLYWTSKAVTACTVTGPGFNEKGTEGAGTTGAILDASTYRAVCTGPNGISASSSVTIDLQ